MRTLTAWIVVGLGFPLFAQSIRLDSGLFQVDHLPVDITEPTGGWPSLFAVYAGPAGVPPMLGTYLFLNGVLSFKPRFPLKAGQRYRAVLERSGGPPLTASFDIPGVASWVPAKVEHVYPSSSLLPENQLKFYIQFSSPMSRGMAWRHIHLIEASGQAVELPFLEIDQELWDPEQRRLTVLFDPGRIKRGVTPLEEEGPAIVTGRDYTLVIDREWSDANGSPLVETYSKKFRVGPPDRTPPDLSLWKIEPPRSGSTDSLIVRFPEPMEFALATRLIDVRGSQGLVAGTVEVAADETEWRFTPQSPWRRGSHQLIVDTALEDLAGNRIGRAFDVDTLERPSIQIEKRVAVLKFWIQ